MLSSEGWDVCSKSRFILSTVHPATPLLVHSVRKDEIGKYFLKKRESVVLKIRRRSGDAERAVKKEPDQTGSEPKKG